LEQSRKTIAKLLNASVGEIFFTSSATEANNMILKSLVFESGIKRIISSPTEHHCVLHSLDWISQQGLAEVFYLPVDHYGKPDLSVLESHLSTDDSLTLVSLMYGNNEIGTLSDIEGIAQLCHTHGALLHCDAVQAVGKIPIDLQKTLIHYLSASAHKFHGPKGCGFIYIRQENMINPFIHGGAQERNMRAGTENTYGIAGMAKALEIAVKNIENTKQHLKLLRFTFKEKLLEKVPDVSFNGDLENESLPHILSVSFPPHSKGDLLIMNLDIAGISASSGSACASGIENDSHVLQAIGHDTNRKTIRFSFSIYNTLEEIVEVVEKIAALTTENTP
jgi:cysteine desulfurase